MCTWMKYNALAVKLISLTAPEALPSAALMSTHMQEYDVKVWRNYYEMTLRFDYLFETSIGILLNTASCN